MSITAIDSTIKLAVTHHNAIEIAWIPYVQADDIKCVIVAFEFR